MAPSLDVSIGVAGDCLVVRCWGGCGTGDVLKAAGLAWTDLFGRKDNDMAAPRNNEGGQIDYGLRSRVYTHFLGSLQLTPSGRASLKDRGITDEAILRDGYRYFDQESGYQAARSCVSLFGAELVLSVPGFSEDRGEVYPTVREGLAVPIMGLRGEIRAIQVRVGGRSVKYATLSGGPGGSAGTPAHVPIRSVPPILKGEPFAVTEGPIKANVATDWWMPTVGILGVNSFNPVLRLADQNKPSKVVIAFDMDKLDKPGVRQAEEKLIHKLQISGVEVEVAEWDPESKGIDDALFLGKSVSYRQVEPLRGGTNR